MIKNLVPKFVTTCAKMTDTQTLKPHVAYPHSYAFGRSHKTLQFETLDRVLEATVTRQPDQRAIVSLHENIEWTFQELKEKVDKLAQILIRCLFVSRGDVVAIMTANTCKFIVIQYACARVGAILCPINAYYQNSELEFSLLKINPKVLFIPGPGSLQEQSVNQFYDIFMKIVDNVPQSLQHVVLLDGFLPEKASLQVKIYSYDSLWNNYCWPDSDTDSEKSSDGENNDKSIPPSHNGTSSSVEYLDADKPCALFFTSGTTGPPKAATLSHFNLNNNTRFFGEKLGFGVGKTVRVCLPVPIFHVFGSVLGTITMSTCGISLVFPGFRYDIESTVQAIISQKCTHFMGVPAMLIDIINYVEDHGLKITTLRGVITAATTVPFEVVQKFCKVIPSIETIQIVYGATETSPIITTPVPGDRLASTLDNVGIPLDFAEVKIVDKVSGDIVKIGETGELLTRGPQVFLGYWCDEIQTKKAIDFGGWYRTGDLATMDRNGYIRIVGRTKEIIIRGGINVYPKEIEEVLITNPYIANAAVCGIPHDRLGEDICAWIKFRDESKKLNQEEIKEFCKDKMAYFKIPRWIVFVTEFPTTASGKVQKFRMRELSCEIFGIKKQ
ncbi:putative acyl-CoA synthetase YngI [Brevipalpus obovatus]|uniref:putative acyl-CoA synthetase YngI n=1 Tax=Brevipalpus obovatus TaxID=246614 RepID=UPI003D9E3F5D